MSGEALAVPVRLEDNDVRFSCPFLAHHHALPRQRFEQAQLFQAPDCRGNRGLADVVFRHQLADAGEDRAVFHRGDSLPEMVEQQIAFIVSLHNTSLSCCCNQYSVVCIETICLINLLY